MPLSFVLNGISLTLGIIKALCYLEVAIPDCGDKTNVSVIGFENIMLSFATIVTVMLYCESFTNIGPFI